MGDIQASITWSTPPWILLASPEYHIWARRLMAYQNAEAIAMKNKQVT